jgi:hypothetical protein
MAISNPYLDEKYVYGEDIYGNNDHPLYDEFFSST